MRYSLCYDLLNSNKILYCFAERFKEYMNGKTDFNPWSIEIHPTAKCNHRCIHCSYKARNESRISINQDAMEKLITSVINMKIKGVYFSGGGEPTLYPNLKKYIEKLYKESIEVSLITNGTLLEESGIIDIANMLNYIAISVPSCNETTFEKITNSKFLNKVLEAPKKIKDKHGLQAPIIGSRIVITNLIYKEVPEILETMKERGFDYAIFKVVRDYEDRGLGLSQDKENYLKEKINELKDKNKINSNFTNLDKIFDFKKEVKFSEVCITNQLGMIANVNTDGTIYPNIVHIGDLDFCIGNINEEILTKIWNSKRHREVKENSNMKWKKCECKNCRAIGYNQIIDTILKSVPKELDPFI